MLTLMHARVLNEEPLVLRGAEIAATGKLADPQSLLCYDGNNSPGGLTGGAADKVPRRRRDIGVELTGVCFPRRVSAVLHPPGLQQQPGQGGGGKQHHAAALPGNKKKIFYSPQEPSYRLEVFPAPYCSCQLDLLGFAFYSFLLIWKRIA